MWAPYPLNGDFKYGPLWFDEKLLIWGMYNISQQQQNQDIIYLFCTYTYSMWIAVFVILSVVTLLLMVGRFLLEEKKDTMEPIWIVSMFMLDQDYLDEVNNFLFVLSTFLSWFCFFNTQYLLNNMSTDMVVIKDPIVVRTYQDILDMDHVMPIMLKGWPDYHEFEYGHLDTIQRKVWEKGIRMAKERGMKSFMCGVDPAELLKLFEEGKYQRVAGIARSLMTMVGVRTVAKSLTEIEGLEKLRVTYSRDPISKPYPVTVAVSPHIDPVVYKTMFTRMTRALETGIAGKSIEICMKDINPVSMKADEKMPEQVQIETPDSSMAIQLDNIHLTLLLLVFGWILGLIALFFEKLTHKSHRNRRKIRPKKKTPVKTKKGSKRRKNDTHNIQQTIQLDPQQATNSRVDITTFIDGKALDRRNALIVDQRVENQMLIAKKIVEFNNSQDTVGTRFRKRQEFQ